MAQDEAPISRTNAKRKRARADKGKASAHSSSVPPPEGLLPRRSLMDALREAQVPSAPSADPTSQPRREKKKRGSRAKGTASPPTPPGLSIDGTEAAAKAQASSEAKDQSDSSGDAVDLPKKPSRARAKAEPIFTPFEVEEAEVIIIRRR